MATPTSDCNIPNFNWAFTIPIPKVPFTIPFPRVNFNPKYNIPVCPMD